MLMCILVAVLLFGNITERIVTNVNRSDGPLAPIDGVYERQNNQEVTK